MKKRRKMGRKKIFTGVIWSYLIILVAVAVAVAVAASGASAR